MVECFSYTIVECIMGAHAVVSLDVPPLLRIFMYEVLSIEMFPILANVMY